MSQLFETPTSARAAYIALRVCPRADADVWWSAVRRRHDIPYAITALLGGRARIELTPEEANYALAWAGSIEGWPSADPKPLFVYPQNPLTALKPAEFA